MKVIHYFPLYVLILLWLQARPSRGEVSEETTDYGLAVARGMLTELLSELRKTQAGPLKGWLVAYVEKELETVITLQNLGVVVTGYIPKDD